MILKEVEIFDFKSIRHERLVLNSNQLCFVGINESGKTSILEAISYLNVLDKKMKPGLLNKASSRYNRQGYPQISGVFELTPKDRKEIIEAAIKSKKEEEFTKEELELTGAIAGNDSSLLEIKRWGNGFENLSIVIQSGVKAYDILGLTTQKAEFLDKFFATTYPTIEFYQEEELLIEPATIEELQGEDKKFETFRRLLFIGGCTNLEDLNDDDDEAARVAYLHNITENVNQIFKRHYKQDDSIEIIIYPGFNNKITLSIKDSTKKIFSISERSPGFQYYFAFLVNKIYLNHINQHKGIVYLLDEPGHNLHPQGAKDLIKTFFEISEKNQILYTTHNPFLTIRNNIDSLIFVQKDKTNGSKINRKPYLNKYQILRKELGMLLNDSFILGDINLIVEGATEKLALHRLFINEFEDLQWINIYNADGVTNISQALNYLGSNNLNLSGLVLIDSDSEAKIEKGRRQFVKAMQQQNWGYLEINFVFGSDSNERMFEDLFPQNLYIDAFNQYCSTLSEFEVFDRPYTKYPANQEIPTPILSTLSNHFFSFINEENKSKKSISKQDVIRTLLDNIDKLSVEEKTDALSKTNKLIKLIQEKLIKIGAHVNHQA